VIPLRTDPRSPWNPQAQACLACGVRSRALFGVLDEAGLAEIHHHIADIHLEPGQHLFSANERGHAAYTLREGVLRLERSSERGDRRILRLSGRTQLVGMEAMLGQTYAADAIACTPVRACRLPRVLVDELAARQPELLRDLMKRWQNALDEADEWLTELCTGSARWRMLRLLLKLTEYGEPDGRLWLPTRSEMGAMLGLTVETTSRMVAAFKREGVLQTVDARHARVAMPALAAALKAESEPAD
jgi:CRP-like cAMP-binding protein